MENLKSTRCSNGFALGSEFIRCFDIPLFQVSKNDSDGKASVVCGMSLQHPTFKWKKHQTVHICSRVWFGNYLSCFGFNHISCPLMLAGALPPADSRNPLGDLDRLLLGLRFRALANFLETGWLLNCMRLAAGVGTGNSTAKHARSVGDLFSSGVFNKTLSSINEII